MHTGTGWLRVGARAGAARMEVTKPTIGGVAMQGTWQVGMESTRPAGNTALAVHNGVRCPDKIQSSNLRSLQGMHACVSLFKNI